MFTPNVRDGLTRLSRERLNELLGRLRELDPAPGASLSDASSPTLHPDVIVETGTGGAGFEVRLVDSGLPPVEIDPDIFEAKASRIHRSA